VGPTASGKSAAALAYALEHDDVELVSVDSMQVYRGMDIGTAKPTAAERSAVRHHLIDVADPADEFTVAMYKEACRAALHDIEARGRRALLVGGTGLYLRAVVDDLDLPGQFPQVRDELESVVATRTLHDRLVELDPSAAARMEPTNRRRVVRALEVTLGSGRPFSSYGPGLRTYPPTTFTLVGLHVSRSELDRRIEDRLRVQMAAGFLDEVRALRAAPGGLSRTAGQALGYRELLSHLAGELDLDEAVEQAITRTRQFARRQERWFRRDPRIGWVDGEDGHNVLRQLDDRLRD
jgi:tRNA dimethylallyltransferase